MQYRKHISGRSLYQIVALSVLTFTSCQERAAHTGAIGAATTAAEQSATPPAAETQARKADQGRALAQKWCVTCHLLPAPSDLPRERWAYMLKWMGNYLGHPNRDKDVENLIYPSLVPTQQSVTREELAAIQTYYETEAPLETAPAFARDQTLPVSTLFQPRPWPGYDRPKIVTLVEIDMPRRRLFVGTADDSFLRLFDIEGKLLKQINCSNNQAVDVRPLDDGFDLVLMGSLGKNDHQGTVHRIMGVGATPGPLRAQRIVTGFHRTSGAAWGDLNGDGQEDVVLAGFGDYADGALTWFANQPNGEAARHDLRIGSGALDAVVDDVDRDGDLDVLSIVAQGHQEMWWFENDGAGAFQPHLLWKERSAMGYNAFQWTDFDGDGDHDIIAVSGNNMEMFDPPLKPLHGVYVYLQTAPMQFTKTHFLRMDGATKALAADYDRDGDTDIAAISAYPDWRAERPIGFVLFTRDGPGKFTPYTIDQEFIAQPITMDAGDLDGDGDIDLVIGGASWAPLLPEALLAKVREQVGRTPSVVLLRNQSVRPD